MQERSMRLSNIHFIVQSLPAKEVYFRERLQSLTEKPSFHSPQSNDVPPALKELESHDIRQCVVGPKYFAFLMKNGSVCRLRYSSQDCENEENFAEVSESKSTEIKPLSLKQGERAAKVPKTGSSPWVISGSGMPSGASALRRWGTHIGVIRSMASSSLSNSSLTTSNATNSRSRLRNQASDTSGTLGSNAAGVRLVRTSQFRGRGLTNSLLTGQRVILPASHVPEELINQVQGILQGKSRSIIIRELQRTNLDVNLAVNNLLSRDDEENEDLDDNGNDYMPGEDLLSLLDSGVHPADHGVFIDTDVLPDDLLGYTFHRASRTPAGQRAVSSASCNNRDQSQDRDPIIRLRSPRFFEPVGCQESEQFESVQQSMPSTAKKAKVTKKVSSVRIGEKLEWWMENSERVKFLQIGAMYSELVAVDVCGNLRQWDWCQEVPYKDSTNTGIYHPRARFLGLEAKKVVHLAACYLRASVLAENGGVATWIDYSVSPHASVLEHPLTDCVDADLEIPFNSKKHRETEDKCLHVCPLYSAVFTTSGEIYWWGVLPIHLRKKILEKAQSKGKKDSKNGKNSGNPRLEVKLGSLVQLRSSPMFQSGSLGILFKGGKPRLGCLQQSAWQLTDKCVFKILRKTRKKDIRIDIKDVDKKEKVLKECLLSLEINQGVASKEVPVIQSVSKRETVLKSTSAGTDQSAVSRPFKRKRTKSYKQDYVDKFKVAEENAVWENEEDGTEETCSVQDVIFIEDQHSNPAGKVLKVDGDMVAVMFSKSGKFPEHQINNQSILNDLRLLRKEDVNVVTSNAPPKIPDYFLKTPRKIPLESKLRIHALSINERGISAIEGGIAGLPLRHIFVNMLGKIISDAFPTSPEMLIKNYEKAESLEINGTSTEIFQLHQQYQEFFAILKDRHSCLYPMIRNENSGIRDPHWLNLPPLMAVGRGMCFQSDLKEMKGTKAQPKTLAVTTLVFKSHRLMPMIILHDQESVQRFIENINHNPREVQAICDEYCDGLRNILHVAVSVCAPKASNDKSIADNGSRVKKSKETKKRETARSTTSVISNSTTMAPNPHSRESSRIPSTVRLPKGVSSSAQMSSSDRVDAVNAIASAISAVTQGERGGSDARFMRDIVQQFAAVLDDQPVSAVSTPSSSSTTDTPTIMQEARQSGRDGTIDSAAHSYESSPAIPTSTWPPESFLPTASSHGDRLNLSTNESSADSYHTGKSAKKPKRKRSATPTCEYTEPTLKSGTRPDALAIIRTLCSAKALEPILFNLMSQKDALGHTPFMSAVYLRAYPAAIELFKYSQDIASRQYELLHKDEQRSESECPDYDEIIMSMIFPKNSDPDANPLYVLCANDTCSFTWTGAQHINQDIFECWTCGLTGTLCCCSECARVCHNGHDCKLKSTSPTAYCDCWEKCACRSLVTGDVSCRVSLLQKLLHDTKLVNQSNGRGETMLYFLAQTVARQSVEQRQHRTHSVMTSSRASHSLKGNAVNQGCDIPQHDLQPPTFCREAFLNLLHDWNSIHATVMSDCSSNIASLDAAVFLLPEEEQCMASQNGTNRLDAFTLCLLLKCSTMYLDTLLETLINQVQKSDSERRDKEVVHRFVRSLVRIFVVLSTCATSEKSTRKSVSRTISNMQPLKRINRAFNALLPYAIEELCEVAKALIDPVRMGIATPTPHFQVLPSHADAIHSCETAFEVPPFTPRQRKEAVRNGSGITRREDRRGASSDAIEEAFIHDLLRIDRSMQAEEGLPDLERNVSNYQPVLDDNDGDNDASGWQNEGGDHSSGYNKVSQQLTQPLEEQSDELHVMSEEEASALDQTRENSLQKSTDRSPKVTNNLAETDENLQELITIGNASDDAAVMGGHNPVRESALATGESDVDLTLAASDADTDAGSNHGQEEDPENRSTDGRSGRESNQILYLEEDDGMSEEVAEEEDCDEVDDDDEDDDEDNDNADEEEGDTLRTSDDDGATASEPDDGGTQECDVDSAGDQIGEEEEEVGPSSDWLEFPLERAPTRLQRSRAALPPHSMCWAVGGPRAGRTNSGSRPSDVRQATPGSSNVGSGLIYVDPLMRRTNTSAVNPSMPVSSDPGKQTSHPSWFSVASTNSQLARAFGICVREMAMLFITAWKGDHVVNSPLSTFLEVTMKDIRQLENFVAENFAEIWKWLLTVIDSTEAQLRYGQALQLAVIGNNSIEPSNKERDLSHDGIVRSVENRKRFSSFSQLKNSFDVGNDSSDSRQDFLSYMLSLMRSHSREHADYLPVIDVSSLRHVAYVLDALVFYLRETAVFENGMEYKKKKISATAKLTKLNPSLNIGYDDTDEEEDAGMFADQEVTTPEELYSIAVSDVIVGGAIANAQEEINPGIPYAQPLKAFFRRSESMTFLGCAETEPFTDPLVKALPLADKPHLLQPNARKEELFGRPRHKIRGSQDPSYLDPDIPGTGMGQLKHKIPSEFGKSLELGKIREQKKATGEQKTNHGDDDDDDDVESKTAKAKMRKYFTPPSVDALLGRCRLTLELFTKIFLDDVGNEPKSILRELGGFEVREAKFRKEMEKLRNCQTVDLQLNVERDPHRLITQTFKQMNQHFRRRAGCSSSLSMTAQPLAVQKVKVVFKDEPGEGSGVARSFYTTLCEALLSSDKLPPLDDILVQDGSSRKRAQERERVLGRAGGKKLNLRSYFMARYTQQSALPNSSRLSLAHETLSPRISSSPSFHKHLPSRDSGTRKLDTDDWSRDKRAISDRLLLKVKAINPDWSKKIIGMLMKLPISELLLLLTSDNLLRAKVHEVSQDLEITNTGLGEASVDDCVDSSKESPNTSKSLPQRAGVQKQKNHDDSGSKECLDSDADFETEDVDVSTFPLFYQPGKRGFYSPAAGPISQSQKFGEKMSMPLGYEARLNAFRNVGRIIGLCLLQNELCPLPLNRHVLKAILGRKVNWHDFAFFDPVMFESMRYILAECDIPGKEDLLEALDLTFTANLLPEEGGGEVALMPGGSALKVNHDNLHEYVRRYTTYRMITCCYKFVEQMRDGLFDVLPRNSLDGLTAEDFRLLANGCGRVDVRTLVSYTSFNDESGKSAGANTEKLTEFKRWFWSVVDHMNNSARQELLYFWTGSPALPASEDGFQPMPTITIRPPDDHHLPTANTCISRLYVPLYSSRLLLKQKLLIAIKTKNFGFV